MPLRIRDTDSHLESQIFRFLLQLKFCNITI